MFSACSRRRVLLAVTVPVAAAALMACVALGSPALRQQPNQERVWDNSDPAVLVADGRTYLFGSTNNMRVPVRPVTSFSATLAESRSEWARHPRDAMPVRPAWVDPSESDIWAPSVAKFNSTYVMFFAAHHRGATTDEGNDQCIGRALSASPMGPYAPEPSPAFCGLAAEGATRSMPASNRFGRGALDPQVFRSPDGRWHMVVALSRTEGNIASLPLRGDGTIPGGLNAPVTVLARQSMPWHDGTDDANRQGGFLENPSMIYEPHTRTYLLFFSAGRWDSDRYNTSFSRCSSPTGPCTQDERGPFLVSSATRSGPGGLTVFRDAGGALRVAYATWQRGHEAPASNRDGTYSRRTHWASLLVSKVADPAAQTIKLG